MPPLVDRTKISRRSFHKLALAGLGLPAASPAVAAGSQSRRAFDVLVVGGGVSGAYIAWRLMTGDPRPGGALARLLGVPSRRRPRVALLEASDRIGGRLHTVTLPEAPHLHAELGGMRFLQTHESVGGLARHLGLDVVDFPMGGPNNRQRLRGVNFLLDDYEANPAVVPHQLRATERGHPPWRLVVEAFLAAFPRLATMSPDEASEYLKTAEFEGRPLWEVGFWNFLMRPLSPEAFSLVCAASGYDTIVSNWNAYDAIVFITEDFASPAYHRLAGGYQGYDTLPLRSAKLNSERDNSETQRFHAIKPRPARLKPLDSPGTSDTVRGERRRQIIDLQVVARQSSKERRPCGREGAFVEPSSAPGWGACGPTRDYAAWRR